MFFFQVSGGNDAIIKYHHKFMNEAAIPLVC